MGIATVDMSPMDLFNEATSGLLTSLSEWACNPYGSDLRYIGYTAPDGKIELLSAELVLYPLPIARVSSFEVRADGLIAGQYIQDDLAPSSLLAVVNDAINGTVTTEHTTFKIPMRGILSPKIDQENQQWTIRPTLVLSGNRPTSLPDRSALSSIDQKLRMCPIPFDGIGDLVRWLAVEDPRESRSSPSIKIILHAPCEVAFADSGFDQDTFTIAVNAHPDLNTDNLSVAVVGYPGQAEDSRHQLGPEMVWANDEEAGLQRGKATVSLPLAERALVIVSVGQTCVQRQWFAHTAKSQNDRLLAVRAFDKDLKQIRYNLFEGSQPEKFELAVAALAFLRGFIPSVQLETDSPDIVLMTPGGQMVLVECTLSTKDVHTKVGKLVDRRHTIAEALAAAKMSRPILAVLVTRQQRDQIAMTDDDFRERKIGLVTRQQLEDQIQFAGHLHDPDLTVSTTLAAMSKPESEPEPNDTETDR